VKREVACVLASIVVTLGSASVLCADQEADRLNAIIKGEAFGELGEHGQAVTLYLAATRAPTWEERERLLTRVWTEYPDSAAVDVAHALAGRHYRDAGDRERAIEHFRQAVDAARARNRSWWKYLQDELDTLTQRVAQAPRRQVPSPAPEANTVRVDASLGAWAAPVGATDAKVQAQDDGSVAIEVAFTKSLYVRAATFAVTSDIVAVGATVRVKCDPDVYVEVAFADRDDTRVSGSSLTGQRQADGAWLLDIDFAKLPNAGTGNYVMEQLKTITIRATKAFFQPNARCHIELREFALRTGEPVRTADAPEGDAALQPARVFTDEYGLQWRPRMGAKVTPGVTHEGQPGFAVSAFVAAVDDREGGGIVNITPPEDTPWRGSRLVFWCRANRIPFLPVIIHETDGTQLVKRLTERELAVGEWRRVEIAFAGADIGARVDDVFDAVKVINLVVSPAWDRERRYFEEPGDYGFAIAGLHLEGEGSVHLKPRPAGAVPPLQDDRLSMWFPYGAMRAEREPEQTHEGQLTVRLTAAIDDPKDQQAGGHAIVRPLETQPWLGDRLVFWCYPRDVAWLPVIVVDQAQTQVSKELRSPELVVGQWNRVEIPFRSNRSPGVNTDTFGQVEGILFAGSPNADYEGRYLTRAGEYVWYIADLHVEGKGPVKLDPAPTAQRAVWTGQTIDVLDENGARWTPYPPLSMARDTEVVHEGKSGIRVSVKIDPGVPKGSGGTGWVRPPEGEKWLGDKLVFWCYPRDVAFLPIIANDSAHNQIAVRIGPEQLKVGQWNRVEVDLRENAPVTLRSDTFGDIAYVYVVPDTSWDFEHEYLVKPGEYVWYLEDMHVEGAGPIELVKEVGEIPDLGMGMSWGVADDCTVQPETNVVAAGGGAARLAVRMSADKNAGGRARIKPLDGQPWAGSEISFACRAETVAYLDVTAQDSDGTTVIWYLRKEDLAVGEWRHVRLSAANLLNVGGGDNTFNDIVSVSFQAYATHDPRHLVLPREGEVVWYLDDFAIAGGPAPVRRAGGGPKAARDDTGDPWEWSSWGRATTEEELAIVKEGARSLRLTLLPERPGARMIGWVSAKLPTPRACTVIHLWLWPAEPGPFSLQAVDSKGQVAQWNLPLERLGPGEWNELVLFPTDAAVTDGKGNRIAPEEFGPVGELRFWLSGLGQDRASEGTCYVDSVRLLTEEGAP
jgi:hypothetical protein